MNRLMQWVIAAALICSSTVFTSCSDDDNSVDPAKNLSEKIIGKWIIADRSGQAAPTNEKTVATFLSATKATISMSRSEYTGSATRWSAYQEYDVNINGDKVTLTRQVNESVTLVNEYVIKSITNTEIVCDFRHVTIHDGQPDYRDWQALRLVKLNVDYKEAVLGLWECTGLSGGETFNDANARLEFYEDGTYNYWRKNEAGEWESVTSTREFQNYFADGTLLATRWKNQGEDELREWWEIESISGDQMVWKALRQKEDGSTSVQKMTWKKIDLNIADKIIGKWMQAEIDGKPALTNEKTVTTFISDTKAYVSASRARYTETIAKWAPYLEYDVKIEDNKITLTGNNGDTKLVNEYVINVITENEIFCLSKHFTYREGREPNPRERNVRYVMVTRDYKEAVLGTWEGKVTSSEGSEYDDGELHRWEYKADGNFVYYVQNGNGEWVPSSNTLNQYFVDGVLLCTRWIDNEIENREWWEIASIKDGVMKWTALRQKEDGSTYTATFEMTKVE